jgi:hypothetical protein
MNCDQATRLMSEGQERHLSASERTTLRMHTWICVGCRNYKGQLGFMRRAMKAFAQREEDHGLLGDDDEGAPPAPGL